MRRPELLVAREGLVALGLEVTSRWLDGLDQPGGIAQISREDIERSELYILFSDERGDSGHRHVEFGIAMGLNKPIIVVASEAENTWQRLQGVTIAPDWDTVYKIVGEEAKS
jgi:hypothetical protein